MVHRRRTKCWQNAPNAGKMESIDKRNDINYSSSFKLSPSLVANVQKFGFINGVDNVNWPPYRDSKS